MPHVFDRYEIEQLESDPALARRPLATQPSPGVEGLYIVYRNIPVDLIAAVEEAIVPEVERAEARSIRLQLHWSPSSPMASLDPDLLRLVLSRLFREMILSVDEGTHLVLYVSDSDGKCLIELVSRSEPRAAAEEPDYFRKYRITNPRTAAPPEQDALLVFRKVIEDMKGELSTAFFKDKKQFLRVKFPLG